MRWRIEQKTEPRRTRRTRREEIAEQAKYHAHGIPRVSGGIWSNRALTFFFVFFVFFVVKSFAFAGFSGTVR
jgi:hypothetical protein